MLMAKQIQAGIFALATLACAAGSAAQTHAANARVTINPDGTLVPTEAFALEMVCLYEAAGWDATMNFAENFMRDQSDDTLRDSVAEEIKDCASRHNWDAEMQTLAFDTFLYAAVLEYNIEQTGSARLDSALIFEIWGGLSDEDKAAVVSDNSQKDPALLSRTAAAIRAKAPNASDRSVGFAQNALSAVTLYSDSRFRWIQAAGR